MDYSILKKLGLNDKEIKIYLSLLEYGAISVRGLSDITDLNRGTVYDILKKLQSQGVVSYYHQKTKQRFVAEPPVKLIKIIEEKEKEIKETKDRLKSFIPELDSLAQSGEAGPVAKFYEKSQGIRSVLEDVLGALSSGDEYYVYSATLSSGDINSAYPNFTKDRIRKKIKVKAISMAEGGKLSGLDERRWLGSKDDSATFIIIYKNKCAFISRDKRRKPVGVIIENKMIYETQRKIFLNLWKLIK